MPTDKTQSQVDPAVAHFQTFFAALSARNNLTYLACMCTFGVRHDFLRVTIYAASPSIAGSALKASFVFWSKVADWNHAG